MRDGIYEYLKVAMPSNKTKEQNLRLLGNILKELKEEGAVSLKGLSWFEVKNPTKKNYNRLEMTNYDWLRDHLRPIMPLHRNASITLFL